MRILNQSTNQEVNNITIYLIKEEASELFDSLRQIIAKPEGNHAHVSDSSYKREITICIYEDGKLEGFNDASKKILSSED